MRDTLKYVCTKTWIRLTRHVSSSEFKRIINWIQNDIFRRPLLVSKHRLMCLFWLISVEMRLVFRRNETTNYFKITYFITKWIITLSMTVSFTDTKASTPDEVRLFIGLWNVSFSHSCYLYDCSSVAVAIWYLCLIRTTLIMATVCCWQAIRPQCNYVSSNENYQFFMNNVISVSATIVVLIRSKDISIWHRNYIIKKPRCFSIWSPLFSLFETIVSVCLLVIYRNGLLFLFDKNYRNVL